MLFASRHCLQLTILRGVVCAVGQAQSVEMGRAEYRVEEGVAHRLVERRVCPVLQRSRRSTDSDNTTAV